MSNISNPYEILCISPRADLNEVNRAYKKLMLIHHPDKNDGKFTDLYQKIQDAHNEIIKKNTNTLKNYKDDKHNKYIKVEYITTYREIYAKNESVIEIPIDESCLYCLKKGYIFCDSTKEVCPKCKGTKIITSIKKVTFRLTKDIIQDNIIMIKDVFEFNDSMIDVKIEVKFDDSNYTIEDEKLVYKIGITFRESFDGLKKEIVHPNGTEYFLASNKLTVINPFAYYIWSNSILPIYLKFIIDYPDKLSNDRIKDNLKDKDYPMLRIEDLKKITFQ